MEEDIKRLTKQVERLTKRLDAMERVSDSQPVFVAPVDVGVVSDFGFATDYLRGIGVQTPGQMPACSRVLELDRESYAKIEAIAFRSTIRSALQQGKYLVIVQSSDPIVVKLGKNTLYKIGNHIYLIK